MYERPEAHAAPRPPRRRGGRRPAAALQERERELLDVAKQLFVRDSYHQVSIATIATTVRVATKTIYVKFGGKRGLLRAVVERDVDDWQREVDAIEASGADIRARLETLACLMLRRALSEQRAHLHADAMVERSPELAELVAPVAACDRAVLARLMADCTTVPAARRPAPTFSATPSSVACWDGTSARTAAWRATPMPSGCRTWRLPAWRASWRWSGNHDVARHVPAAAIERADRRAERATDNEMAAHDGAR
ncbi:TetR/AcrR family transcriptional regulator [Massilia phosphatilytica]